jgi:hypothetical protein
MAMASAFATAMIIEGKGSKAEETDKPRGKTAPV